MIVLYTKDNIKIFIVYGNETKPDLNSNKKTKFIWFKTENSKWNLSCFKKQKTIDTLMKSKYSEAVSVLCNKT
jgi:hypothetical protein